MNIECGKTEREFAARGTARQEKKWVRRRGMEEEVGEENAWNGDGGENPSGRGKMRERGRETAGGGRETERDGDLGSAYRSGRVTCVPEVGVLAWTNRRATPLSLSLFLCFSRSPPLPLSLFLSPIYIAGCPPTRFFLQLPRSISRHAQIRTQ